MQLVSKRMRRKLRLLFMRYLPAEIGGTIAALAAALGVHSLTGSLAAAAIAGTIGENIGYYGVIGARDALKYWKSHHRHAKLKRIILTGTHSIRDMLIEFGPAELMDTLIVRPGLMYSVPSIMGGNPAIGFLIGKILADIIFYGFAVIGHETKQKIISKSYEVGQKGNK